MTKELEFLEELQIVDLEILRQRKELNAIPEGIEAMRKDVAYVAEILEREKERLAEAEQWRAVREKEIVLQNDLLGKSKAKLQAVRNEKEQKAAQREIDNIRKAIQDREEESLKVMEASEQYRKAIDEHTREFAELENHLKASDEEGRARMAEIEVAIGKTQERRRELIGRVPQNTLRLYDRIQKRLGRALVEAVDGHCTGCNMEILPQRYNELQKGDKLFQCDNCFRILVFKPKVEIPHSDKE